VAHGATLIHPGAASGARRWPAERFAAVARTERAAGRRVVVTGGPDEVELANAVAGDGAVVLTGRTSLIELAGAVAAADRVLCGDTGVAHLATAFRTPSVVLFGPTPPALWGPPVDRPWHRTIWTGHAGSPHATEPHEGLLEIEVDEVLSELEQLPPALELSTGTVH
jgi:ADP-heptose:LPS heptosyltransferase